MAVMTHSKGTIGFPLLTVLLRFTKHDASTPIGYILERIRPVQRKLGEIKHFVDVRWLNLSCSFACSLFFQIQNDLKFFNLYQSEFFSIWSL